MRKFAIFVMTISLLVFLYGCDFPEKSLQALSTDDVPKEVTRDFTVPRGVYGLIIWESSNEDVLKPDQQHIYVYQQEKDISVTLTARVNKSTESFTVVVLKKGSSLTHLEKGNDYLDDLTFCEELSKEVLLDSFKDGYYFSYEIINLSYITNARLVTKSDETVWLVPIFLRGNEKFLVTVTITEKEDNDILITLRKTFELKISNTNETLQQKVFQNLMIVFAEGDSKTQVSKDFDLPTESLISSDAVISWSSLDQAGITISNDGKKALVTKREGLYDVRLVVTITIDEISYDFDYLVTIISK
ncbi:MAG: hypothetical protein RBQ97_02440 [Acholeplasma sp.]|nr:hypothetical protein [Acholeplasma sp.]